MINIQHIHVNGQLDIIDENRIQQLLELNTPLALITIARKVLNIIDANINAFTIYLSNDSINLEPYLVHFNINFKFI